MKPERRSSTRFPVTPSRVKAELRIGRETFKAELLDESMSGFALILDIPRRRLGEQGFTTEADCDLFGEIGRLNVLGHSEYEVQIISIIPHTDESASATRSRVSLRLGTRVVREIYAEDRNSLGRNLRLSAAILLAMCVSLYCTARTFSGQIATILPTASIHVGQFAQLWDSSETYETKWSKHITHATENGYVVPGSQEMTRLLSIAEQQPVLRRVQRVMSLQKETQLLSELGLSPDQLLAVRQIALEAQAQMEHLWKTLQAETDVFQERLTALLAEVETKIVANLTASQAQLWMQAAGL